MQHYLQDLAKPIECESLRDLNCRIDLVASLCCFGPSSIEALVKVREQHGPSSDSSFLNLPKLLTRADHNDVKQTLDQLTESGGVL